MTIIVQHRRTGNNYILLSINGEMDQGNPSRFINELFNQEKSEKSRAATVCDVRGNIFIAYIDDLVVIEIEGKKLTEILPEATYDSVSQDSYREQATEFAHDLNNDFDEEQELRDEDFVKEQDLDPASRSETFFVDTQSKSSPRDGVDDEDNDDWI